MLVALTGLVLPFTCQSDYFKQQLNQNTLKTQRFYIWSCFKIVNRLALFLHLTSRYNLLYKQLDHVNENSLQKMQ